MALHHLSIRCTGLVLTLNSLWGKTEQLTLAWQVGGAARAGQRAP